ncbi:hypothetical protein [Microbulbifer pacificus]|uniref:hypothetical protein n=1 Tax=Microbulbifer pacificus TaxID=407164 RepID=UPI001319EDC2|nr:hypothetical protein [Microbulbifer pacificus]
MVYQQDDKFVRGFSSRQSACNVPFLSILVEKLQQKTPDFSGGSGVLFTKPFLIIGGLITQLLRAIH